MTLNFSKEEKKSVLFTTIICAVLVLLLFYIRFIETTSLDQLAGGGGGGVEINFGDSEFGAGEDYTSQVLNVTDVQKNRTSPPNNADEENILAQENTTATDVTVLKKEKEKEKEKKNNTSEVRKNNNQNKVSNTTNDALANFMKGNNKGGDGDDQTAGNKGRKDGSLSSNNYYGDGGSGGGTGGGHGSGNGTGIGAGSGSGTGGGRGYSLSGRKALVKPLPKDGCNEAGTVVVEVSVDRSGNVISATPGIRGTTNNSSCLLQRAKAAALATKWESSTTAPSKQVGSIVYEFQLR